MEKYFIGFIVFVCLFNLIFNFLKKLVTIFVLLKNKVISFKKGK